LGEKKRKFGKIFYFFLGKGFEEEPAGAEGGKAIARAGDREGMGWAKSGHGKAIARQQVMKIRGRAGSIFTLI